MKTTVVRQAIDKRPQARTVPLGEVYSWGTKQFFYLRVKGGAVQVANRSAGTAYDFIPDDEEYRAHFNEYVDIVSAELTLEF